MTQRAHQRGFTYAMVLVGIIVIGILAEVAHLTTTRVLQADREAELLFRGLAYRRAIESYFQAHGRFPQKLEDLVRDPSSASRRHLRALYRDPFASRHDKTGVGWALLEASDGGVSGVASRHQAEPLKRASFPPGLEKFKDAETYADWVFRFEPRQRLRIAPVRTPQPPDGQPPLAPPLTPSDQISPDVE